MSDNELIKELFERNKYVSFYARNRNILKWRKIGIEDRIFPFCQFLKAIGIYPEQLRPLLTVRNGLRVNLTINSLEDLPEIVSFGTSKEEYLELAKLIRKPVAVYREYDHTFSPHLFTVYPDGHLKLLLDEDG